MGIQADSISEMSDEEEEFQIHMVPSSVAFDDFQHAHLIPLITLQPCSSRNLLDVVPLLLRKLWSKWHLHVMNGGCSKSSTMEFHKQL
jgi:hypothetical protein